MVHVNWRQSACPPASSSGRAIPSTSNFAAEAFNVDIGTGTFSVAVASLEHPVLFTSQRPNFKEALARELGQSHPTGPRTAELAARRGLGRHRRL